jgi:putative endonuclease
MKSSRQFLGRWGETLAANYLTGQGYTILGQNIRTPYGEIDLIARKLRLDTSTITIFVEVKTRTSRTFGLPEESVTLRKQAHLLAAVQYYLQEHPDLDTDWRIDVIAIERYHGGQPPTVTHFENAVS